MKRSIPNRRGTTLFEATVALGVLLVTVGLVAKTLIAVAHQQRTVQQRRLAMLEAGNVMERIMARKFDDLLPGDAATSEQSDSLAERLPGATLRVTITAHDDPPLAAKQIVVEISWDDANHRAPAPLRLTAWKYRYPSGATKGAPE